jgi:hypothetical protein
VVTVVVKRNREEERNGGAREVGELGFELSNKRIL